MRQFADKVPSVIVRPIVYGPEDKELLLQPAADGAPGDHPQGRLRAEALLDPRGRPLRRLLRRRAQGADRVSADGDPSVGVYFLSDGSEQSAGSRSARGSAAPPGEAVLGGALLEAMGFCRRAGLGAYVPLHPDHSNLEPGQGAGEMSREAWTCSSDRARGEIARTPPPSPSTRAWPAPSPGTARKGGFDERRSRAGELSLPPPIAPGIRPAASESRAVVMVDPARTPGDRDRFITFQLELYRKGPNYVPPIVAERRDFLDPAKNPFFAHAEVEPLPGAPQRARRSVGSPQSAIRTTTSVTTPISASSGCSSASTTLVVEALLPPPAAGCAPKRMKRLLGVQ